MDKWYSDHNPSTTPDNPQTTTPLKLFYKFHMSSSYKTDERVMKDIIHNNVTPTDPLQLISLVIYYK